MGSAQRTIKSFVLHKYGLHISAEKPEFDRLSKKWTADIKSDYPLYLQDDRDPDNVLLHFIPIKHIGKVSFDENLTFLNEESTTREICIKNLQSLLKSYKDRTEKIVVQASADCFVQIPEFRHFFTPIDQIITSLMERDFVTLENLLRFRGPKSQAKIKQYLKLLESIKVIERTNDNKEIKTSETYWLLYDYYQNQDKSIFPEEDFRKAIISKLVSTKYSVLTQVFEISRFRPTIHIDSCIYRPAIEAEELICLSNKSIIKFYTETYGKVNEYTLLNHLRRLQSVNAIQRKDEYWCGTKELLDSMLQIKNEMPILSPPLIS